MTNGHPTESQVRSMRAGIRAPAQRRVLDLALAKGWSVRRTGTNHLLLTAPDRSERIAMSTTVNDQGPEAKNNMAALKRWMRGQT